MTLEIEAKIKVESCEPARERLRELGARQVCSVLEINQIFDTPDRQLFGRGCGLRIRTCCGQGDVPPATLTYKGPQQAGPLKSRPESETGVLDPQSTRAILEALGYSPVITFEKRREEWEFEGLQVALDEVPRLGNYIEIEGPDEQQVSNLQHRLGLGDRPCIRDSYIALLINHARENHLSADRITF
jgi:adenylate cyclase, class 2